MKNVIKTLIIPNSLISKTRKKLNIWQTHFGSIFKTSYSKTSTERWLLNLSLKLSLCPDRFPPPGCLILTRLYWSILLWDSYQCIFQGPDNISLLIFEVLEVLHLVKNNFVSGGLFSFTWLNHTCQRYCQNDWQHKDFSSYAGQSHNIDTSCSLRVQNN